MVLWAGRCSFAEAALGAMDGVVRLLLVLGRSPPVGSLAGRHKGWGFPLVSGPAIQPVQHRADVFSPGTRKSLHIGSQYICLNHGQMPVNPIVPVTGRKFILLTKYAFSAWIVVQVTGQPQTKGMFGRPKMAPQSGRPSQMKKMARRPLHASV